MGKAQYGYSTDFKKQAIKFTPLELVGIFSPSLELAYEYRHTGRLSSQLTLAYYLHNNLYFSNTRGLKIGLEEKLYLRKEEYGPFVSIEYYYSNRNYKSNEAFSTDPAGWRTDEYIDDTFYIRRKVHSVAAKFGYQLIWSRFAFEIFSGLGVYHFNKTHLDAPAPPYEFVSFFEGPCFSCVLIRKGTGWGLSIPINGRIGFQS